MPGKRHTGLFGGGRDFCFGAGGSNAHIIVEEYIDNRTNYHADNYTAVILLSAKTFERASQEYNPKTATRSNDSKDYYGKAIQRIPVWALKPSQYNHKIIRAYFEAVDIAGEATLTMMERLCSDKDHPELYVPTFRNNYSQMKIDGPKSHGKVFEDDGERVWIWSEVETVLLQNKNSFYQGES